MLLLQRAGTHALRIEPDATIMELAQGFPRRNQDAGPKIAEAAAQMVVDAFARIGAA